MALDTRNKRASAVGLALAWRMVLPHPDGTIATADRQQAALCYAGIDADAPTAVGVADDTHTWRASARQSTWRVGSRDTTWRAR